MVNLIWRSDRSRRSPAMRPENEMAVFCDGDRQRPFLCLLLASDRVYWYRTTAVGWLPNLHLMHVDGDSTPMEELEHAEGRESWERLVERPELLTAMVSP